MVVGGGGRTSEGDDEVNRLNRIIKDLWVMCVNSCFLLAHAIGKL